MLAQKGNDYREQESARDAHGKRLVDAAVRLHKVVCAHEVRYENLVSAAEADPENHGKGGEVARKHAGGHRGGAHVHDHRGDEHLEKLETDGFRGGGEADAHPVGEEDAGTLPVAGLTLVLYLELEHHPQNARRYQPRECGGEGHAVYAHLGEPEEPF